MIVHSKPDFWNHLQTRTVIKSAHNFKKFSAEMISKNQISKYYLGMPDASRWFLTMKNHPVSYHSYPLWNPKVTKLSELIEKVVLTTDKPDTIREGWAHFYFDGRPEYDPIIEVNEMNRISHPVAFAKLSFNIYVEGQHLKPQQVRIVQRPEGYLLIAELFPSGLFCWIAIVREWDVDYQLSK